MMQGLIEKWESVMIENTGKTVFMNGFSEAAYHTATSIYSAIVADLKAAAVSVDAALDTSEAKLRRVEAGRLNWQARAERLQESLNDANAQIEDLQDAVDYSAPHPGNIFVDASDIFADDEETAVFGQNPPATADASNPDCPYCGNEGKRLHELDGTSYIYCEECGFTLSDNKADAPQRDESDGGAGFSALEMAQAIGRIGGTKAQAHCPECSSGKTAVFEGLDWVLHCEECAHIFRKTDGAAPPPREAGILGNVRQVYGGQPHYG